MNASTKIGPDHPIAVDEVVVTHEDIDRAYDRSRVSAARRSLGLRAHVSLLWLLVGPGILVMLGENDGPSMLSYAATGAKFGIVGQSLANVGPCGGARGPPACFTLNVLDCPADRHPLADDA